MNSPNRAAWRGYFAISLVWMAVLAGALLFTRRPAAQPIEIIQPPPPVASPIAAATSTAPPPTLAPTLTPHPLRVDVIGAVAQPGVKTLPPGSIVDDAIRAAGGPSADADIERVNKAAELLDGSQVYVPRKDDQTARPVIISPTATAAPLPAVPQRAAPPVPSSGALIDLNSATLEELDTLPGVGPKTAQLIVDGRPYANVDDLLRVKGIGPATLAKIKPLVTIR